MRESDIACFLLFYLFLDPLCFPWLCYFNPTPSAPALTRTVGRSLPAEQFPESVLLQLDILCCFFFLALFRQMFRFVCRLLFCMRARHREPSRTKFNADVMWLWSPRWRQKSQSTTYRKMICDAGAMSSVFTNDASLAWGFWHDNMTCEQLISYPDIFSH